MSPPELRDALDQLDMEQIELARLVDAGKTTAHRWSKEGAPGCISLLLRLLLARPELKELIGARPRTGRGRPVVPREGPRKRQGKTRGA